MEPPSVCADGVELTRLLDRTQLTLAQAVELSAAVAAELARRSGSGSGAPDREPARVGPVRVGGDGRVLADRGGDVAATAALLARIADAVRPRARGAGAAAEQLLAGLDDAVAELPDAGVPAAARELRDVAGAIDRGAVRAEIGALVRALQAEPGAPPGNRTPGAGWAPDRAAARPPTGRGRTARRTARRRAGAWVLSVLVLAGVVLLEVGFLRGHIVSDIGVLLDAGRGGAAPTASAARTPDGLPIAAPAPASAGPVAGVDLRQLAPCAPGTPCGVRLEVRLTPGAGQRVVTWSYRLVDRCTGAQTTAPGGTVTLPDGAPRAAVVGTVALPAAPGVALIAVTRQPAAAASAPLVVGACPSRG